MIKFINLWSCSDTFRIKLLCLKFKLTGGVQLFSSVSIVACSVFSSCKQIVWLLQFYSLHTLVEIHCLLQIRSPISLILLKHSDELPILVSGPGLKYLCTFHGGNCYSAFRGAFFWPYPRSLLQESNLIFPKQTEQVLFVNTQLHSQHLLYYFSLELQAGLVPIFDYQHLNSEQH